MSLFCRLLFILFFASSTVFGAACYPSVDTHQKQYIVGYGSLMKQASRSRTAQGKFRAYPIEIQGFKRGWIAHGSDIGFSTTFLGIVKEPNTTMNAVYFSIVDDDILHFDQREQGYCRVLIPHKHIKPYVGQLASGQYWIYVNMKTDKPNKIFPIVQSYVDLFLSGCMEVEAQFRLAGFAKRCISTTHGWSQYWVNDRVHPRRPFIDEPKAMAIDHLLHETVGEFFKQITIE